MHAGLACILMLHQRILLGYGRGVRNALQIRSAVLRLLQNLGSSRHSLEKSQSRKKKRWSMQTLDSLHKNHLTSSFETCGPRPSWEPLPRISLCREPLANHQQSIAREGLNTSRIHNHKLFLSNCLVPYSSLSLLCEGWQNYLNGFIHRSAFSVLCYCSSDF